MAASDNSSIIWIGPQSKNVEIPSNLLNKDVLFYKKCLYRSLTLCIGDFVLISNADSTNHDVISSCEVAKILYLYELVDILSGKDPYRAIVQWYTRPQSIGLKYFINNDINVDFDFEVVEDYRPYINDISIETIFDKCNVVFGKENESVKDLINLKQNKRTGYTFGCRYKYLTPTKKITQILPILPGKHVKRNDSEKSKKSKSVTESDLTDNKHKKTENLTNNEIIDLLTPEEINCKGNFNKKRSPVEYQDENCDFNSISPSKKTKQIQQNTNIITTPTKSFEGTPRLLRRRISKIEAETPKRSQRLSQYKPSTPRRSTRKSLCYKDINDITENLKENLILKTPIKLTKTLRIKIKNNSKFNFEDKTSNDIHQEIRDKLFVGALMNLPDDDKIKSLPCREKEFQNIYSFLLGKINDQNSGSMYISGVPGTGKTATVTAVINRLKYESKINSLPEFEFIEINGMRLTKPQQAYVQIYKELSGKTVSWNNAQMLLEKKFTSCIQRKTTILLVDEFDALCNRRQDVVYNLLDWPTKSASKLVIITIANTMDLPERVLKGKVTSRLGLTRLTFSPYTFSQLQEIVSKRLGEMELFKSDAIQLVARKVASVSGDARRALNICRRAVEICQKNENQTVNMSHVQEALSETLADTKVQALQHCSKLQKDFIQAIAAVIQETGVEETTFNAVYLQMKSIAAFTGNSLPSVSDIMVFCLRLGAQRLILCENPNKGIHMKILLNVSADDIHYAFQVEK